MSITSMDWPYLSLQADGTLRTDDGDQIVGEDGRTPVRFASTEAAEQYLVDNDIRGSVR